MAGAFTPVTIANPCNTGTVACGGSQPSTLTVYKINPALTDTPGMSSRCMLTVVSML